MLEAHCCEVSPPGRPTGATREHRLFSEDMLCIYNMKPWDIFIVLHWG
jgi:hypothetical protein